MLLSATKTAAPTRKPSPSRGRARRRYFKPVVERLEDRRLLAAEVWTWVLPDVNVSNYNDNQAEPTIDIDPTNRQNLFAASVTFYGNIAGTWNPGGRLPHTDATAIDWNPGLFAAYSNASGAAGSWSGREMATGGPGGDSLPAANGDPQAKFDEFGNLFLTYISSRYLQWGTSTGDNGGDTLKDTTRSWVPGMWNGMWLTVVVPGMDPDSYFIHSNTERTIRVTAAWRVPVNTPGTRYIVSVPNEGGNPGSAVVLVQSIDAGRSFRFLRQFDTGAGVDYPAVATGPGRDASEQSVWVAWKSSNGNILAAGAPVTAKAYLRDDAFLPTQTVNGSNDRWFPRAQVGPDGQVMVSFNSWTTGVRTNVYVNVDDNGLRPGGFRASSVLVASGISVAPVGDRPAPIPAQPSRGITPQVNLAWDRSGRFGQPGHGRVYLVYTNSIGAINDPDTDIRVCWSNDSGAHWTLSDLVSTGAGISSQFLPSVAVDQWTGHVAVVWLDARNDPNNAQVELWGAVSVNGGGFGEPFPISSGRSDARFASRPQWGSVPARSDDNKKLLISGQEGVPDNYWKNYNAVITAGPGEGQSKRITESAATELKVETAWGVIPAVGNFYEIRPPGLDSLYAFDYGEYTGLAFYRGRFYPVWADNSNSTGDNRNGFASAFELYTAAVDVFVIEDDVGDTKAVQLGTSRFAAVPAASLLEAALLLSAQRSFPGPAPAGAPFDAFVRQMRAGVTRLSTLAAAGTSPGAASLMGGAQRRRTPSLQDLDLFFRAAWADGVLSRADVAVRLG